MLLPIKLKSSTSAYFIDPLDSHKCQIEEHLHEITDTWGGYEEHALGVEVTNIRCSKIAVHYEKINRILGFKEQQVL